MSTCLRSASSEAADAAFDGAIAVNTLQFCEPFARTAAELFRVLKPGGRLVSLTHDWVAKKHAGSTNAWLAQLHNAFQSAGFSHLEQFRGSAERGRILGFEAIK